MLSRLDPLDVPRLDVLDEEFGESAAAVLHARRRRNEQTTEGLKEARRFADDDAQNFPALAFAWSNADGPRFGAAIGGYRVEKCATRGSGGDRATTGRPRRAEERRQGAHGS